MLNDESIHKFKCLVHSYQFEILWNYYQQCDGQLFDSECRNAAIEFFKDVDSVPELNQLMSDSAPTEETIGLLHKWRNPDEKNLFIDDGVSLNWTFVRTFFICFNKSLSHNLGLGGSYPLSLDTPAKRDDYLKWRGHLPLLRRDVKRDTIMAQANQSETVVVIGDIRRSQELMKYADNPKDFATRMLSFLQKTKSILFEHGGVFDKFTGDGFIGYFNESICNEQGLDWIECFVGFLGKHRIFCHEHFQEWETTLKKLPTQSIGVGIGADLGAVAFHHQEHQLVAVGEPIVWAARMTEKAKAGQVIANNRLYEKVKHHKGLRFSKRKERTKAGEEFVARIVLLAGPVVQS